MITLPFSRKKKGTKKESLEEKKKETKEPKGVKIKEGYRKSTVAYRVLKAPIVSEKGTLFEKEGKYIFKVFPKANKNDIKRAIEEIYKVKVEKVNIIKTKAKRRRIKKQIGWKSGYKKAIVTLEKGKKIEVVSR